MAERQDSQERTEQPTPKRIADAKRKGQIPRSRELSTMLILMGGAGALYLSGEHMFGTLTQVMTVSFSVPHVHLLEPNLLLNRFIAVMLEGLVALAPLFAAATVLSIAAPLAVGGWSMSGESLAPKLERLNPIKGLKRVFGPKGLMELFKALTKFVLILGFAIAILYHEYDTIARLGLGGVSAGLAASAHILFWIFLVVSSATIVVALIDVPFQLWQHHKNLRMSRQELKDEFKETDGSPELKGRIRAMQQEVARQRMMEEVPSADVVVTNPDHYAVALKFDPLTMSAPIVVAKGLDLVATRIRDLATDNAVPLLSAPPLARALYHTTKLHREIPTDLYVATAKVLAYVFQLRDVVEHFELLADLPIPDEFKY